MEYLMTYGWAILVIIIVIAVLFYIGVLNPRNVTPTVCTFPPGISCSTFKLSSTTGDLSLTIGQATGHRIRINGTLCTQGASSTIGTWDAQDQNITQGEAGNQSLTLNCFNAAGTQITSGTVGETAKFKVYIAYNETDTGTTRQAMGDVTGRYEPA